MKKFTRALLLMAMTTWIVPVAAHAGRPELILLGGVEATLNRGASLGYTGGAGLALWTGPVAGIEVGGQYLARNFTGNTSSLSWVEVPVSLRVRLGSFLVLGAGGYYDIPITTGAGSNYGAFGSLRLRPGHMPLFLEGRFNFGLNTSTFGSGLNEGLVLVGLAF
jgi:hypothetical protein